MYKRQIHWTAGDARRTFHEKGEERPDPRQESDRKRTTASTPVRRTDSRGAQGEKAPNQQEPHRSPQAHQPARAPRRTRKARLRLTRVDPWSVMKTSLLFDVLEGKGWTSSGISKAAVSLARAMLLDQRSIHPVCTLADGVLGFHGEVSLSLPTVVGGHGVEHHLDIALNEWELSLIHI